MLIEVEWEGGMWISSLPGCVHNQGLLHLGTVDPLGVAEEHQAGEPVGAGGGGAEPALAGAVPVQQLAELGVHHEGVQLGVVADGQHYRHRVEVRKVPGGLPVGHPKHLDHPDSPFRPGPVHLLQIADGWKHLPGEGIT